MNNTLLLRATSFKGSFSVLTNQDTVLARVKSHSWFGTHGEATFADSKIQFVPTSIFSFRASIVMNQKEIGSIHPKWNSSVRIRLNDQDYLMKSRGILSRRFEISDSAKRIVLTLRSSLTLRYLSYNYEALVSDPHPSPSDLLLLLIIGGFTANIVHRTTPS